MLVGIVGYKRSGKNTVGGMLQGHLEERDSWTTLKSFAEPVKLLMSDLLDIPLEDGYKETLCYIPTRIPLTRHRDFEHRWYHIGMQRWVDIRRAVNDLQNELAEQCGCYATPRQVWQLFGTEVCRKQCENIWVNVASKEDVIYTDVRYPNEAQMIKENGGVLIRVNNPDITLNDDHDSEAYIDKLEVDYEVTNKTDELDETENQVVSIIDKL